MSYPHLTTECHEHHDLVRDWGGPAPKGVVTLCGSTRFYEAFQQANYDLTMAGHAVLSVGFYPHAKAEHGHGEGVGHDSAEKVALDELHKRKIDLADVVLILNVGGYIGASTRSELDYALAHGKPVRYLEYFVWSREHRAWWKADAAGYTPDARRAGRYTHNAAVEVCGRRSWRSDDEPPEVAIPALSPAELGQPDAEERLHQLIALATTQAVAPPHVRQSAGASPEPAYVPAMAHNQALWQHACGHVSAGTDYDCDGCELNDEWHRLYVAAVAEPGAGPAPVDEAWLAGEAAAFAAEGGSASPLRRSRPTTNSPNP